MENTRTRASAPVRIALAIAIGLVTVNAFTTSPLLALWIASKTSQSTQPSLTPLLVLVVVLIIFSFVLLQLINLLSAAYDSAAATPVGPRKPTAWLRSLRGERPSYDGPPPLTTQERVVAGVVTLVLAAMEIWFLFFSGSPFDAGSGR